MLPTFQQYPKLNPTATTENHDLDMDFSNYEVAKEQKNSWQVVKKRKRENQNEELSTPTTAPTNVQNRYDPLTTLTENDTAQTNETNNPPKMPKPPPIFIYGVKNFKEMIKSLSDATGQDAYYTKTLPDETVKINALTIDTYRKLIKHLKKENIIHHTYQPKEERAYRVVIRHLHYSIPTEEIKLELEKAGHKVRNIMNIKHRVTKEPLSLFFVDLEPQQNNKEIFKQEFLYNTKITIEAPKKNYNIIQCMRCQSYGHSKTYCSKPFNCVKCGQSHDTKTCTKPKSTPAKCALCSGDHPANYKGCTVYKELVASRNRAAKGYQSIQPQQIKQEERIHGNTNVPQATYPQHYQQTYAQQATTPPQYYQQTYAQAVKSNNQTETSTNMENQFSTFLDEFKSMFTQLMNQNSMILNLLTTVIGKLSS
jgi:hypothetical protein